MKITYNNITIDFFNGEHAKSGLDSNVELDNNGLPKQVLVSLSGGCDSASALYLCLTHFPDIEYIPYTCRDLNAPLDADSAILIVEKMQKEFPNANLKDIEVFEFNDKDPAIWPDADYCIKHYERYKDMTTIGMAKILLIDRLTRDLMKSYSNPLRLDGMSSNPSIKEMKAGGFFDVSEPRRTHEENWPNWFRQIYQPFINVNKKFVAAIYHQHPFLLNEIYPHTRSCVGTAQWTDNFTRVCGKCFWCYERRWAFGEDLYPINHLQAGADWKEEEIRDGKNS
jgi:7-cyano-7-deazaguanine synthase in queuosine biosynthesis